MTANYAARILPAIMTDVVRRSLLDWVCARYPDTPKTRAKQWIRAGRVSVRGVILRQPHLLLPDPGTDLELRSRHATAFTERRIHPLVSILHLDRAVAVLDKGAGLLAISAHPRDVSAQSVLADFLAGRLPGAGLPPAPYRLLRPLPVHRLDQYTSGVFCLAMNPAARRHLITQVKNRTLHREYIAYVEGKPSEASGTWCTWLKLSADKRRQLVVRCGSGGQQAITHFEVIRTFPEADVTKLRLRLVTGCKHQIRVQAAHAGLPLVGDRLYNPHPRIPFERQALHAAVLSLEHPDQPGVRCTWTAPLPADLVQLEARLRRHSRRLVARRRSC